MAQEPRDLHLPESFHRLKRTLLLLCAGFAVLGLATVQPDVAAHFLGVDIRLGINILRVLLWLAALYYFIGFFLEFQAARAVNSQVMANSSVETVDRSLLEQGERIKSAAERIATLLERADGLDPVHTEKMAEPIQSELRREWRQIADRIRQQEQDRLRMRRDHDRQMRKQAQEAYVPEPPEEPVSVVNRTLADLETSWVVQLDRLPQQFAASEPYRSARESLRGAHEDSRTLISQLEVARKDMRRLMDGLGLARRASFWWWEFGGAVSAFVLATLVGLPPIGQRIADHFDKPAQAAAPELGPRKTSGDSVREGGRATAPIPASRDTPGPSARVSPPSTSPRSGQGLAGTPLE